MTDYRFVQFIVEGEPIPKGRPRVNTQTGHAYTPARTREYEEHIGWTWLQRHKEPFVGPVRVTVVAHEGRTQRAGDADNYLKIALDAMNTLAFADDKQVEDAHVVVRRKSFIGPCMVITIAALTDESALVTAAHKEGGSA